jgi:dipeptidyl-peptidase-4
LRIAELDGSSRELAAPTFADDDTVTWGSAEFVAAEEMSRGRGYWWSPDGASLAVARVDTVSVPRWWIADPANPAKAPVEHPYPAAGAANAEVGLWVVALDGTKVEVRWDHERFEYLANVAWAAMASTSSSRRATSGRWPCCASTPRAARPPRCSPTATTCGSSSCPARRRGCPTAGS